MRREPFNSSLIHPAGRVWAGGERLTVSQVTALVKRAIESALPSTLHVIGEVSNFKRHSSGHLYLTLKDGFSELSCVMWRSNAAGLRFEPADGMEVVATGSIEVFERTGRYQLHIRKLQPVGIGALELAFRQLCEKLSREGLFDERHKRPLPVYPERIALVTSPTGAAVTDILQTIQRRYPCVHILIYPVPVQGPGAATEIAAAICHINDNAASLNGIDLIIVGRGGGSLEDLWAFNEEIVARAIHASRIPIISAVGHEVDLTIADLVADVRAATPTAAAELAVPVLSEVLAGIEARESRLARSLRAKLDIFAARLSALLQRRPVREPLAVVRHREQVLDELADRMRERLGRRLRALCRLLDELEPAVRRIAPPLLLLSMGARVHLAEQRLLRAVSRRVVDAGRSLNCGMQRFTSVSPVNALGRGADQLRHLVEVLTRGMNHRAMLESKQLQRLEERLAAVSYASVLARGFSITRTKKGRKVVRSMDQLRDRQRVVTRIADGEFESEVVNLNQLELFG